MKSSALLDLASLHRQYECHLDNKTEFAIINLVKNIR